QEWCCHYPREARFRLAGLPLPGGSRTLWIGLKGFRSHFHSLSWTSPGATAINSRRRIVIPRADQGGRLERNRVARWSLYAAPHQSGCGPSRLCRNSAHVRCWSNRKQQCTMELKGIVAKRRDSRYRSGRSREWLKVKNHAHPAYELAVLIALSKSAGSR